LLASPNIIAGQVDVLPAERREVGQQVIRDILKLTQGSDRTLKIGQN
jgi:hypothetical protein